MNLFEYLILILYALLMCFVFFYSLSQAVLVYHYVKSKRQIQSRAARPTNLPLVTIQLPLYNELFVVERLINKVCQLNYPAHLLEIQILDDSTDETSEIIKRQVAFWKQKGCNIIHLQRDNRIGYKAGALKEGLEIAKGEFIAIFDADFLPDSDFLMKTIPEFTNPKVGMVQTKWTHLNEKNSLLTRLQAFGLNAHFTVEQTGRNFSNSFINFNGTAGVWRKECIIDSGNWEADTLTEDLDLSYRAQLKNWKFIYLEDVASPAELPPAMSALKTQQYRWTKGGAETAKKHLSNVWKSNKPIFTKFLATAHLLNSCIFLCILATAILSFPVALIKINHPAFSLLFLIGSGLVFSFLILFVFYEVSAVSSQEKKWVTFFKSTLLFPTFLIFSMGLSLHNAIAVLEGLRGKHTPFIRTPKFNSYNDKKGEMFNKYRIKSISIINVFEFLLAVYFLAAMIIEIRQNEFGFIPFQAMLFLGFLIVFAYSVNEKYRHTKNIESTLHNFHQTNETSNSNAEIVLSEESTII